MGFFDSFFGKLRGLQAQVDALTRQLNDAQTDLAAITRAYEAAQMESNSLKVERTTLSEENAVLRLKMKKLEARIAQLEGVIPPPAEGTDPVPPPTSTDPILPLQGFAKPTFHCCGLYWTPPSAPGGDVKVEYKKASESVWKLGHPLWYDGRNNECRGSLFDLTPNTLYNARLSMPGAAPSAQIDFQTWSENYTVKSATLWTNGNETAQRTITVGGSEEEGYVVYGRTAAAGGLTTITRPNQADAWCVVIDANYVVVRGCKLVGGEDCIRIKKGRHHIIIEDNEITKFGYWDGSTTGDGWQRAKDSTSGIRGDYLDQRNVDSDRYHHIVVQRNKIHTPAFGANSWQDGHPNGSNAISWSESPGPNVIRYNEIYSSGMDKAFNDPIGGGLNFSRLGFPGADSDIYKNSISHCWDDAIESEGGNRNVRIFKNYTDRCNVGIASTSTSVGPLYVVRNVHNRSKSHSRRTNDNDNRNHCYKNYANGQWGGGRTYFYHNTMLQYPGSSESSVYPLGNSIGISGTVGSSGPQPIINCVSRNNILEVWKSNWSSINNGMATAEQDLTNSFDYDLYNGTLGTSSPGAEVNGIKAVATYKTGHGPTALATGKYQLNPGSSGHDKGQEIPNINDGFLGAAPDMGAHEEGSADMVFGTLATGS